MDYVAGREDRIAAVLDAHDFDYVVGSVHFVRDRAVDDDGLRRLGPVADPDRGLEALLRHPRRGGAAPGLYDILAHPDLVKVWGPRAPTPERDPRFYYEPAVEAIAETGVAVEVSTAGLAQAGRRAVPGATRSRRCASTRARLRPVVRRALARAHRVRLRARGGRDGQLGRRASSAVFERRANAGWSRSADGARVGIGYDSHRFAAGRRLVLGGVEIEHELGLEGHSDADVVTHAVIDAVLGAAGLGDLGTHFPPDDERWRDADSLDLLRTVLGHARGRGRQRRRDRDLRGAASWRRTEPRWSEPARSALAAPVSVKATTNEGMGFVGRGEGIACIAVALVARMVIRSRSHGSRSRLRSPARSSWARWARCPTCRSTSRRSPRPA